MANDTDKEKELNPGQTDADKKLNDIGSGNARELLDKESEAASGDKSGDNAREQEQNTSPASSIINNVKGKKPPSNKLGFFRKKGPLAGIISLIIVGGVGFGGVFIGPSTIMLHLKSVLGEVLDDANPGLSQRAWRNFSEKFNSARYGFAESSEGKCNIRCRFGTINATLLSNLQSKGFSVETRQVFGNRHVILSMTFPGDTDPITDKKAFEEKMRNTKNFTAFRVATKGGVGYFLNSRFGSWLNTKLGINKLTKFAGNTKEDIQRSIRRAMGMSPEIPTDAERAAAKANIQNDPRFKPAFDKLTSLKAKMVGKIDAVSYLCLAYDSSRALTFAVKHQKSLMFAGFAMVALGLADQIIAGDDVDPEAVSQVASQYTQVDNDPDSPYYGTTGTDNPLIKQALHGDTVSYLSEEEKQFTLLPNSGFGDLLSLAGGLLVGGVAAISGARALCNVAAVAGGIVSCADELLTAGVSLAGGPVGAGVSVGALAKCGIETVITIAVGAIALTLALDAAKNGLANDEAVTLDETTVGSPVGGALYSGTAQIVGTVSVGSSLYPGTKEEVETYNGAVSEARSMITESNYYLAQSAPFDASNPYSFMGTLARNLGMLEMTNASPMSIVQTTLATIPRSIAGISSSATSAAQSIRSTQRINMALDSCPDQTLSFLGLTCDAGGNPIYVQSVASLVADPVGTLDYMLTNNQIDDEGRPIEGSDYQKFLDYCPNRTAPFGESDSGIGDANYEWKIGINCMMSDNDPLSSTLPEDKLNNFRTYTMDTYNQDIFDADEDNPAGLVTVPVTEQEITPSVTFDSSLCYSEENESGETTVPEGCATDLGPCEDLQAVADGCDPSGGSSTPESSTSSAPVVEQQAPTDNSAVFNTPLDESYLSGIVRQTSAPSNHKTWFAVALTGLERFSLWR